MSPRTFKTLAASAAVALSLAASANAQNDDVIWHNRYHAILAMSAYGDYNTLCPQQTFTADALQKNFPGSTMEPWTILETWGPTPHGSEGFTVLIPEMAKVVLVFKGDYNHEKNLPTETIPLSALNLDYNTKSIDFAALGLPADCSDCRVNAYAAQGWLEAKAATNDFAVSVAKYREIHASQQFYYSITGHGLGGMHSLIASLDLGLQNISFFTHSYGAPRTFSPNAARLWNFLYGGDMTERAVGNGDQFVTQIPASDEYSFTNTAFLWYGYNETYKMNREVCYEAPESPTCMPLTDSATPELDHYFYFANVGQCGGRDRQDLGVAQAFIDSVRNEAFTAVAPSSVSATSTPSSSSTSASSTTSGVADNVSAPAGGIVANATAVAGDSASSATAAAGINAAGAAADNAPAAAAAAASQSGMLAGSASSMAVPLLSSLLLASVALWTIL